MGLLGRFLAFCVRFGQRAVLLFGRPHGWVVQAVVVLALAIGLIASADLLAGVASGGVAGRDDGWWGLRQVSSWDGVFSGKNGLHLTSRTLLITIKGDELAARYVMTASNGHTLAAQVLKNQGDDSGNNLTGSALGTVWVAEYRYGFTGDHRVWIPLVFDPPRLLITGRQTMVTVDSTALRLALNHQYIRLDWPAGVTVSGPDEIQVSTSSVQVLDVAGAQLTHIVKDTADLRRNRSSTATVVVLDNTGPNWGTSLHLS